jgi:hypothetical protein
MMEFFGNCYLAIIPKDLRIEVAHYYADKLIQLYTDYQRELIKDDDGTYNPPLGNDYIYFDIVISYIGRRLLIPFNTYANTMRSFIENYTKQHKFEYFIPEKLKEPLKAVPKTEKDDDKFYNGLMKIKYNEAVFSVNCRRLPNNEEGISIDLKMSELITDGEIHLRFDSIEHSRPLYELNTIESEMLVYKLIKFYNDISATTIEQNNVKEGY